LSSILEVCSSILDLWIYFSYGFGFCFSCFRKCLLKSTCLWSSGKPGWDSLSYIDAFVYI